MQLVKQEMMRAIMMNMNKVNGRAKNMNNKKH